MSWSADSDSLALLDARGGPFETSAYRAALVASVAGLEDRSWGARSGDGRRIAVALVGPRPQAMAVPIEGYGAVRCDGTLSAREARSFLLRARRGAGARRLLLRAVDLGDAAGAALSFATRIGTASVVELDADAAPEVGYSRLTRRSLRRAQAAGCSTRPTHDAAAFLALYREASARWDMTYPAALIAALGRARVARFDEVVRGGEVVAALMTLTGPDHWMCWLAAQSPVGREHAASYLAYDAVLGAAVGHVTRVSFGASAPGTGGAEFKRRLGAIERPILEWSTAGLVARVNDARVRLLARRTRP